MNEKDLKGKWERYKLSKSKGLHLKELYAFNANIENVFIEFAVAEHKREMEELFKKIRTERDYDVWEIRCKSTHNEKIYVFGETKLKTIENRFLGEAEKK